MTSGDFWNVLLANANLFSIGNRYIYYLFLGIIYILVLKMLDLFFYTIFFSFYVYVIWSQTIVMKFWSPAQVIIQDQKRNAI